MLIPALVVIILFISLILASMASSNFKSPFPIIGWFLMVIGSVVFFILGI